MSYSKQILYLMKAPILARRVGRDGKIMLFEGDGGFIWSYLFDDQSTSQKFL